MNLQSDTPAGLRRAALALHALVQPDRDWLLERLPPSAGQALAALLVELSDLGIPPDREVIRVALDESAHGEPLSASEARVLCQALADEASVVQSLLLAALPVPQREAILAHWPHEILSRPSAIAGPAWTPMLHDAVIRCWRELAGLRGSAS